MINIRNAVNRHIKQCRVIAQKLYIRHRKDIPLQSPSPSLAPSVHIDFILVAKYNDYNHTVDITEKEMFQYMPAICQLKYKSNAKHLH